MKYLPKKDWPAPLYALVTHDVKQRRAKYSVTELIQPPQMLQLKRRHNAEIVVDPSDMLWRLMGKLPHGRLEAAADANTLAEEGLLMKVENVSISGQPDLYTEEHGGTVYDYKFTSVWAIKDGVKPEWESQLNLYAVLFRSYGFSVARLRIVAIARDWSAAASRRDENYPEQVMILSVDLWPEAKAVKFLQDRVALHEATEKLVDDKMPPCTADERWASPEVWAVMKKGGKRAVKLHDNEADDQVHAAEIKGEVEHRPREYKRCENYCEAFPFCAQAGNGSVESKLTKAGL